MITTFIIKEKKATMSIESNTLPNESVSSTVF